MNQRAETFIPILMRLKFWQERRGTVLNTKVTCFVVCYEVVGTPGENRAGQRGEYEGAGAGVGGKMG